MSRVDSAQILVLEVSSRAAAGLLAKHATAFTILSNSICFDESSRYSLELRCLLVPSRDLSYHSFVHLFKVFGEA